MGIYLNLGVSEDYYFYSEIFSTFLGDNEKYGSLQLLQLRYMLRIPLLVLDPPGKPEVIDVSKSTVSLIWARPKHDGGSKIIGYFVEACKLPGDKWVRCNTTPHQIPQEEYTATGLEENAQYQFRAIAKTAVNISQPSEPSDPVTIQAENGKILFSIIYAKVESTRNVYFS